MDNFLCKLKDIYLQQRALCVHQKQRIYQLFTVRNHKLYYLWKLHQLEKIEISQRTQKSFKLTLLSNDASNMYFLYL